MKLSHSYECNLMCQHWLHVLPDRLSPRGTLHSMTLKVCPETISKSVAKTCWQSCRQENFAKSGHYSLAKTVVKANLYWCTTMRAVQ